MATSGPLYCLCSQPYDVSRFMIQCDVCKDWFHGNCVGLLEHQSSDIDKYHCPRCVPVYGPAMMKQRTNWHRHNSTEPDAGTKLVQTGTPVFVGELQTRHFPPADPVVLHLRGQQLTLPYLAANGFSKPIIVDEVDGLGITVPPSDFSVHDVERLVGGEHELDVIDVQRQSDMKMQMRDFAEYFTNSAKRTKVLNCISLEFSSTGLSPFVEPPYIARKLDWVVNSWPREYSQYTTFKLPEVQKYCLMGVKDSYTDFHVDFGGTSVWYHVLQGEKIFYIIEPTPANLMLYQRWMLSSSQSETFFGDQVDACYKLSVQQGQTLFVPTGWIHAVLTPIDSLVFGGNFLHSLNMSMQLQVYEMEKKMRTPDKFRFPAFETAHWFAARRVVDELHDVNEKGAKCPPHFLSGVKALVAAFKQWTQDKESIKSGQEPVPTNVDPVRLIKDLSRQIRAAEKHLVATGMASNSPRDDYVRQRPPPRNKSKAIEKDFVDISKGNIDKLADVPRTKNKKGIKLLVRPMSGSISELQKELNRSVYEFQDSPTYNDGDLIIDEDRKLQKRKKLESPVKLKLSSLNGAKYLHRQFLSSEEASPMDVAGEVDIESSLDGINDPHCQNGIEELLKAATSNPNNDTPTRILADELDESGRASPSTREAIVGMLSMGRPFLNSSVAKEPGSPISSSGTTSSESRRRHKHKHKHRRKHKHHRHRHHTPEKRKERKGTALHKSVVAASIAASNIGYNSSAVAGGSSSDELGGDRVHQDDDFIYPSLDVSDEEKPKKLKIVATNNHTKTLSNVEDEAWSPRVRVGSVSRRDGRPPRESAKRPAVEKGLEAAAARRALLPPAKRSYIRRKPLKHQLAAAGVDDAVAGPSSGLPSSVKKTTDGKSAARKPKKGMATAKQRLGKILKIHRMIY